MKGKVVIVGVSIRRRISHGEEGIQGAAAGPLAESGRKKQERLADGEKG